MSVTFTFATVGQDGFTAVGVDCRHVCTSGPHGQICEEAEMYGGFCCDHIEAAEMACGCKRFDTNVSNANAGVILDRLGLENDGYGTIDPDDLIGRCLLANVGRDDSGLAPQRVDGGIGAQMVDMGQRAGYFDDLCARLNDLACEARRRGVRVGWC